MPWPAGTAGRGRPSAVLPGELLPDAMQSSQSGRALHNWGQAHTREGVMREGCTRPAYWQGVAVCSQLKPARGKKPHVPPSPVCSRVCATEHSVCGASRAAWPSSAGACTAATWRHPRSTATLPAIPQQHTGRVWQAAPQGQSLRATAVHMSRMGSGQACLQVTCLACPRPPRPRHLTAAGRLPLGQPPPEAARGGGGGGLAK